MALYHKSLHDQIAETCIHFNGLMNKSCKAGVDYDIVKVKKPEGGQSFACIESYSHNPEATCAKREWPTEEHIQTELDAFAEFDHKMGLAAPLILRLKGEHKGESWQGVEACPACGGKLHLSIAGYNGHCHAHCETKNCLSWME